MSPGVVRFLPVKVQRLTGLQRNDDDDDDDDEEEEEEEDDDDDDDDSSTIAKTSFLFCYI